MTGTVKKIIVWLLIVTAFALAFKYIDQRQKRMSFNVINYAEQVTLKRVYGHYYWPAKINGHSVNFLVDSGASSTTISQQIANKVIPKPWNVVDIITASTANGMVQGKVIETNLELDGGLQVNNMKITILPDMPGDEGLLGMDILSKVELVQRGEVMTVRFVQDGRQ